MTRPVRLPVLPASYGDCISGTPQTGSRVERLTGACECSVLQCRNNLRRVDADDVPGRRRRYSSPEWTLDGEARSASAPSCALDIASLGPQRCAQLAKWNGRSKRRMQQEVKAALGELEARGVDIAEFRALMAQEERGR